MFKNSSYIRKPELNIPTFQKDQEICKHAYGGSKN